MQSNASADSVISNGAFGSSAVLERFRLDILPSSKLKRRKNRTFNSVSEAANFKDDERQRKRCPGSARHPKAVVGGLTSRGV